MNDAMQQSEEAEAPRRSGRERKQVISLYTEAKIAAAVTSKTKKKKAADSSRSERSTRSRKRKQEEEENYDDEHVAQNGEDEYDSSDEEDLQSDATSSDDKVVQSDDVDEDEFMNEGDNRVKPSVRNEIEWATDITDLSTFQTNDEEDIFHTNYYDGRRRLGYYARKALANAQQELVSKQNKRSITLECDFPQVPYHPDMLASYEYFAEGIQRHTSLESFKIINYHLPQTSWLGNSVLPTLGKNNDLSYLRLSNCSLSAADLSSLVDFIANNTSLYTLHLSRTSFESEDTAKAFAKALKKHPAISNVNLAYCSFAGGSAVVDKILSACKDCDSLTIGHEDFDKESVAMVAKFIGKKNSVTSFSLHGAAVDNANKKLLSDALAKNKKIESLCMHSNQMQLPGIIRNTKKMSKSLSRLTRLDLSHNKLPVSGAKQMANFIESEECKLITLVLTNNHLTSKGGDVLVPALKKNTTLQELDLSNNWLTDQVCPVIIDMLQSNSTLLEFDLTGNKSLKTVEKRERRRWIGQGNWETIPHVDGGRAKIVKRALFDTTSLDSIAASNHTCAVSMTGFNHNDSYEETIRRINALDASDSAKIRLKLVLALNNVNTALYNPRSFDSIPLELMPCLLEMLQQGIGYDGFGKDVAPKYMMNKKSDQKYGRWNPLTSKWEKGPSKDVESLSRLYEVITSWQSLPQLFARGPGVMKVKDVKAKNTKKKKKLKPRKKRRKFGDESDDEDEAWIPKGARKTGQWKRDPETDKWEYVPPPVY